MMMMMMMSNAGVVYVNVGGEASREEANDRYDGCRCTGWKISIIYTSPVGYSTIKCGVTGDACLLHGRERWRMGKWRILLRVEFRPSRQLRTHSTWQYQNVAVRFCAAGGRVCLRRVKINHPPLTDCAVAALYTVYQKKQHWLCTL